MLSTIPAVTFGQMHVDHEGETSLGEYEYASFDVSNADGLILMDVAGYTQVGNDGPAGAAIGLFTSSDVSLGDDPCNPNWDPAQDAIGVRFAQFDLAGSRSAWSAPQEVLFSQADDGDGVSCSVTAVGWGR